jgi:predicted transcriptional regulator
MATLKKVKVSIKSESFEEYAVGALARARAMDRGEPIASEIVLSFSRPTEMMRLITAKRTELLEKVTADGPQPVNGLAAKLKRDRRAVSRDISVLEEMGLVSTSLVDNPGHGRLRMVRPAAKRYEFHAQIGPAKPTGRKRKLA